MPKQITIYLFSLSVFLFTAAALFAGEFQNTTGDLTLTTDTVVNGAKWIRAGNLTIGAGVTLQVNGNATLTFENGYRITNNKGGATILVSRSGGRIIKAAVICTNVSCYIDNDRDTYGTGSAVIFCDSCPIGYASRTGDCCDRDAGAYPGAPGFHTTANACGSWDWNCDGVITKNACEGATGCRLTGSPVTCYFRDDCSSPPLLCYPGCETWGVITHNCGVIFYKIWCRADPNYYLDGANCPSGSRWRYECAEGSGWCMCR